MSGHYTRISLHVCRAYGHEPCGTRFEVRCDDCGFAQGVGTQDHAGVVYEGHPLDPAAPMIHFVTEDELRALFARHCECRPLDLMRTEDDHAAIHDCDMGILADIQCALYDHQSLGAEERRAKARAKIARFVRGRTI